MLQSFLWSQLLQSFLWSPFLQSPLPKGCRQPMTKGHNHTSDCPHAWRSKAFKILIYILLIYEDGLKYKGYHERRKSLIGEML